MNRLAAAFFSIACIAIYACIASCSKPAAPPSEREVYHRPDGSWTRYGADFNSSEKWDGERWQNNNDTNSSSSMSGLGNQ